MKKPLILFAFLSTLALSGTERNLALHCLTVSNAYENSGIAVDGIRDGIHTDGFCSEKNYIEIDLGQKRTIRSIRLFLWWMTGSTRSYQYFMTVSEDGKNWTEIVDERKNKVPSDEKGRLYSLKNPVRARYFRLYVTRNTANPASHVREIEIYGEE